MFENIRLSLKGILSHKMRSFLTMLGIIIGIAAIIAIVSTIKGTNEQIKSNLVGSDTNTVTISLNVGGYTPDFTYESIPEGVPVFGQAVKEELLALEQVEAVTFLHRREYSENIFYKNTSLSSCSMAGVDMDYFSTAGYQVVGGRGFTQSDMDRYNRVCIVDKTTADYFDGEDPVGKTVDIKGEPFVVVGVVDQKSQFEPIINSIDDYYTYADTSSGTIYIPDAAWPVVCQYDEPLTVIVKATSTDDMTTAGKQAADILNGYLTVDTTSTNTATYKSQDTLEQAKELQQLSQSTNQMLILIASISLLVGGIGVMNIMLVSVTERTREIGLKKALGARKRQILGQFLTEASVLCLIGGILGVAVGVVAANVLSRVVSVPVAISTPAILVAVLFSMLVGVIFGLLPSIKAAKLNPIDALRYE